MKALLRNTVAVFIALMVVASTSGFAVFHHSCNEENTSEFSIIVPSFDCNHLHAEKHEHASCCGAEDVPCGNSVDKDQCCDTETLLVKLDLEFEIQHNQKVKKINTTEFVFSQEVVIEPIHTEIDHIVTYNNLPPPLGGKALLIFLHQLNIPA